MSDMSEQYELDQALLDRGVRRGVFEIGEIDARLYLSGLDWDGVPAHYVRDPDLLREYLTGFAGVLYQREGGTKK